MLANASGQGAVLMTAKHTGADDAFNPLLYRWEKSGWVAMPAAGAIPVFSPQAPAAQTATGAVVYAGFEVNQSVSTWWMEGGEWKKFAGESPSRRKGAHMQYDPVRKVAVLHAGDDNQRILEDTWEWTGKAWRRIP
jgi:hypothetical protein